MIELYHLLVLFGLGFVLGIEHAFDPDHITAVTTFVSKTKSLRKSSILGAIWGIGHTFTLFLVGFAVLLLKISIPDKIALSFEMLVAIVLILLGIDVLRKIISEKKLSVHSHGKKEHIHFSKGIHNHESRTFIVGLLHGLAGSASLLLLVLATVNSLTTGLLFIAIFGIGSIAGMFFISSLIGIPFRFSSNNVRINSGIRVVAGILSIVLGVILFYQIGFVDGLFFTGL